MLDSRKKAQQKAQQRKERSDSGKEFNSERQKARSALVDEVGSFDGSGVHKIEASKEEQSGERILNVAAYCRVSTDDIDQVISIEMQKKIYRDMIKANPKWRYCGLYVDDGFSGTNTEHRPGFQRMMKDAMAGKIDMIITKSVSRFARNLIDCITWVRRLKQHEPPISVFFEQENLNTTDSTSNIILFVLAMVAEEESHMKSEAMLLSLEWRFSRGRFMVPKLLGYDLVDVTEDGIHHRELVINEDQANTVRLMYYMLLNGSSTAEIAETLNDLERETGGRARDGHLNTNWTASGIATVMRNERYCGDVLARKTWTPDFHTHKSIKNVNKKNKYYQPNHHKGIVTRAQWNAAQRILNSRRYAHKGGYLPMRVIDHGALCGYISINRGWAGYEAEDYYRVCRIAMGLAEGDLDADLENEHLPDGGHKIKGLTDEKGIQRISRELSEMEQQMKAQLEGKNPEETDVKVETEKKIGFQVVHANMFSHAYEPVVRLTGSGITFNSTCIARLNTVKAENGEMSVSRCMYVELLFNPVERMLAVRPCAEDYPNAIRWSDPNGGSASIGARAFCKLLFKILNWDENYSFRVPACFRSRGDEKILLFDLDNFIGHETVSGEQEETAKAEQPQEAPEEDMRGFFYAADEEQPEEIDNTAEVEQKIREQEKTHFGTPCFEHDSHARFPSIDDNGEWDVMAEARVLDSDHQVPEEEIEKLRKSMKKDENDH